jgi:gas vesicle protein
MDILRNILDTITSVKDAIRDRIGGGIDKVREGVDAIPRKIDDAIDAIKEKADSLKEKIEEKLDDLVSGLSEKITGLGDTIKQGIENGLSSLLTGIGKVTESIKDKISEGIGNIGDVFSSIGSAIKDRIGELVGETHQLGQNIIDKITQFGQGIYNTIKEAWDTATEKIRTALNELLQNVLKIAEKALSMAVDFMLWVNEKGYPLLKEIAGDTIEGVKDRISAGLALWNATVRGDTSEIENAMSRLLALRSDKDLTTILFAVSLLGVILPNLFLSYARPGLTVLSHQVNAHMPVRIPEESMLIQGVLRGLISTAQYQNEMGKLGYSNEVSRLILDANRPILSVAAAQEAFLRGYITESEHDNILRKHGFTDNDIRLQKALYWVIPGVSDIIRMAVREAFTPEIAEKFGQYEDLPEAFVEWAAKQGLSKEWASRYWAAHWELPSPQMGFEMLHRRIIDENELRLLLRALDVMPFWRDKLIQLSYNPYTRVDLRRMYTMGILSENDVYNAYLDLGYDREKARNLTEFTVRYYAPEEETTLDKYRDLTRSIYISAYKKGVITREECKAYLLGIGYRENDAELLLSIADAELVLQYQKDDTIPLRTQTTNLVIDAYKRGLYNEGELRNVLGDLGYSEDEIVWYVALTDYKKTLDKQTLILESIHKRYIERTIDKPQAVAELGKLFTVGREQDTLFELWDMEREARVKKLTEAQYRAALQRGIITVDEYADELRGLGYAEKYVDILVRLATGR